MSVTTKQLKAQRREYSCLAITHIRPERKVETYRRAWNEFPYLLACPDFKRVGANLSRGLVVVQTREVHVPHEDSLRNIGEMLFILNMKEKNYRIGNATYTKEQHKNPHPHVTEGWVLCISTGRERLQEYLLEGAFYNFCTYLWETLHVTGGTPYYTADHYPLVQLKELSHERT